MEGIPRLNKRPPRHAILAVNAKSLKGNVDASHIAAQLQERGISILNDGNFNIDELADLAKRHAGIADCMVVGGGDGTMNAVAPLLVDSGLPLGILPLGTANDLAYSLSIPVKLDAALDTLAEGNRRRIDLGKVNGKYFFNVAHIGLGTHVMTNLSHDMKRRWGILGYFRSLLKAIRSAHSFGAEVVCDGRKRLVRSIQIAVGNGRHYGGGMTVMEDAEIDDGLFYFYSVKPSRLWHLLKLVPLLRTGDMADAEQVVCDYGSHLEITTRKPMLVTADGEPITHTPATFVMCHGAVEVFAPAAEITKETELLHAS